MTLTKNDAIPTTQSSFAWGTGVSTQLREADAHSSISVTEITGV